MPAIATMLSIFVIPSLHAVLQTAQPYGLCEETTRAPGFAAVSAQAVSVDLNGLRAVGAGGVASSSRVSAYSGTVSSRRKHARTSSPLATGMRSLRLRSGQAFASLRMTLCVQPLHCFNDRHSVHPRRP